MAGHLKRHLRAYFITGSLTILPIVVSFYIINLGIILLDSLFGSPFAAFVEGHKFPGVRLLIFGIEFVFALLVIILTGFFMTNFIGRQVLRWGEGIIHRLPIIRKIYKAIKQFIETLFLKGRDSFNQVVLVEYPRKGIYSIGLITSKPGGEIQNIVPDELVYVFIPTTPTPQSGLLIIVPKRELIPTNMSIEDGLKLIVSAGIITSEIDENGG